MPEIKHNFLKGRMNKDLDERLVPDGEYRDALNIEVLTSEDGNIGSVQNCLGNNKISMLIDEPPGIYKAEEWTCVSSIVDNKNNDVYWLVSGPKAKPPQVIRVESEHRISRDFIARYNSDTNLTDLILNDIYNVRTVLRTPVSIGSGTNIVQINVVDTDGLRVGMELVIPRITLSTFINWTQLPYEKVLITNILSSNTIEINRMPYGIQTGNPTPQPLPINKLPLTVNFRAPRVLNFEDKNLITGINIVDDMLFWTDNFTEPKKININRCKNGTSQASPYHIHTDLLVKNVNKGPIEEKHITNIKRAPLSPPTLKMTDTIERLVNGDPVITNTQHAAFKFWGTLDGSNNLLFPAGTTTSNVALHVPSNTPMLNLAWVNRVDWRIGDIIVGTNDSDVALDAAGNPREFSGNDAKVRLKVINSDSMSGSNPTPQYVWSQADNNLELEILAIDEDLPDTLEHWWFRLEPRDSIYEFKFPKFGYRYKYEDGEYSAFSPFSELAFLPKTFDYHPKKGYNLGMKNYLKSLKILDFVPKDIPLDVVEVDLLYKESDSPNIYTIKTFNDQDIEWNTVGSYTYDRSHTPHLLVEGGHNGSFEITADLIHAVVESNQLLRPWDNVPRMALAQEIAGNRLIYGNYVQNYDVPLKISTDVSINTGGIGIDGSSGVYQFSLGKHGVAKREPIKSLKSFRSYQVGVVYKDFYGRETPVLSDYASNIDLEKWYADKSNRLQIKIQSDPPGWADSFKYFVKETSNEYYNLALDRWYDAGDENVWLSFPSEDRNKVDDETILILKKGDRRNDFVEEAPKYKILAIENEAPDYIKTVYSSMGYLFMNTGYSVNPGDVSGAFAGSGTTAHFPLVGRKNIAINHNNWEESPFASLQNPENTILEGSFNERGTSLAIRFLDGEPGEISHVNSRATQASNWYNISNIAYSKPTATAGMNHYIVSIDPQEHDGGFGNDVDFLGTNVANSSSSDVITNIHVEIAKKTLENKPEFDGRFFVKILDDISIQSSIKQPAPSLSTNSYLVTDITAQLNHFRGPADFQTLHDANPPGQLTGTYTPGTLGAHSYPWDLENTIFTTTGTPASIPHPTQTTNHAIEGYIGASPLWDWGTGGELHGWEINWEEKPGSTSSFTPNAFGWTTPQQTYTGADPVTPQTHRYPGCALGYNNGTSSTDLTLTTTEGSQALLPTPWRSTADWENLILYAHGVDSNSNPINTLQKGTWFIDNEPGLIHKSSLVYQNNSTQSYGSKVFKFGLIKTYGADIGQTTIDLSYVGPGVDSGAIPSAAQQVANRLVPGTIFSFTEDPENIKYEIGDVTEYTIGNYDHVDVSSGERDPLITTTGNNAMFKDRRLFRLKLVEPGTTTPKNIGDGSTGSGGGANDVYSPVATHDISNVSGSPNQADETSTAGITFYRTHSYHQKTEMPTNPAIFETEPKEDVGLDIYYEISKSYPLVMNDKTNERYIPINSHLDMYSCPHGNHFVVCGASPPICPHLIAINTNITNHTYNNYPSTELTFDTDQRFDEGDILQFTTPDSTTVTVKVAFASGTTSTAIATSPVMTPNVFVDSVVHGQYQIEGYNNCYSFGNGVESNRIRDLYNKVTIDKGVKASTTLAEQYNQERRSSGLIFSGIYNSKMKGVNRLNQFIMAEPITKELNPTYGSIQKLHQRDTDLITLCEDKVLKVLSNKDALFNADGTKNITATSNVLGNAIPFVGDYGISKNPESFASEAYRIYFADKQRGAVLRLSRDGLTPISNYGMKDWFNDNLGFAYKIIGSYDTVKSLYNISLNTPSSLYVSGGNGIGVPAVPVGGGVVVGGISPKKDVTNKESLYNDFLNYPRTLSFRDDNNGWTSFKSFSPETGFSLNNKYYTTKSGEVWEHHSNNVDRCNYHSQPSTSHVAVLFNDLPSTVKSFTTLNYEGSQSRVIANNLENDGGNSPWTGQYYNWEDKDGWWCSNITTVNEATGNQTGTVKEFINKEGKWFNYIQGETTQWKNNKTGIGGEGNVDTREFSVQGIGNLNSITAVGVITHICVDSHCLDVTTMTQASINNYINNGATPYTSLQACMDQCKGDDSDPVMKSN